MSHTFLALDMTLIPKETKKYIPKFWGGNFSNDAEKTLTGEPSMLLLDGNNKDGELVHSLSSLIKWLQWEDDPFATLDTLISTSIEFTKDDYFSELKKPESVWYQPPTEDEEIG